MKQEDFPKEMQELMTNEGASRVLSARSSQKVLKRYLRAALMLVGYSGAVIENLDAMLTKLHEANGDFVDSTLKLGKYKESTDDPTTGPTGNVGIPSEQEPGSGQTSFDFSRDSGSGEGSAGADL